MADVCTHLDADTGAAPSGDGCVECLAIGQRWVHLRRCVTCGHIGCCDSSPGKHATFHSQRTAHPLVQSFEPDEEWYWCYVDEVMFELEGQPASPAHP
jgi:hypothetical protein